MREIAAKWKAGPAERAGMRIERVEILPFRIPFLRPFRTGGREVSERSGLLIRLEDGAGNIGLGEVVVHPAASTAILDRSLVRRIREAAIGIGPAERDVPPVARPALESAAFDLRARAEGARVADLLGMVRRERIPVNATLDQRDPREVGEAARRCVELGFVCLKVKVFPADLALDEARLAAIRASVGENVRLRIDANAAWEVEYAVAALSRLAGYALDYVEQPVAGIEALAEVRRRVRTPIAADESVTGVAAVEALAAAGAADVVVLKPALLGLCVSVETAQRAFERGLGVVVTSTLDTSVGVAGALHLAATLAGPLPPCGLATVELLAGDLVTKPLRAAGGHIALPPGAGLGVSLDEEAAVRWGKGKSAAGSPQPEAATPPSETARRKDGP